MKKLSKGKSALKFILLILGIFLLLWYLAPLPARILNIGNEIGITASLFLIVFAFFFDKIGNGWRNGILILMAVVLAFIIFPLSYNMAKYANYQSDSNVNTVIVLGCKVNGENPSKYLYDRCAAAAEYLNDNPQAVAVLSGGQGPGEHISEAQCMENALIKMGIDKSRLFKEDKSTSTNENIRFSLEVMEANGLSKEVLIVTNEFHEYRSKLICDKFGLSFHSKCSYSSLYTFLTFYTRELMALVKEILT